MANVIEYELATDATGAVSGFERGSKAAEGYARATGQATKAQEEGAKAAQTLGQRMESTGKSMQETGRSISAAAKPFALMSVAAVGAGVAAAKMANDYDREFSKITGLVGIASDEVAVMRDQTLSLAGATARAPQELAAAMFTIQSAGLRGATGTQALEQAARLAAGGMGETRDIAQAMTSILDQYASKNVDAAEAADFLAATARAGNFESSQLAGSLGKVLPVASQLDIKLSDVGGAIALLTRGNGNAAESITQVSAVMSVLLTPSEQAIKTLGNVNLTMADVKATAAGPGGLVAALQQLYDAAGRDDQAFAKLLGSKEAVSAAFQILNADATALGGTFGAVADSAGVADEVFKAAAESGSFKFEQALTNLKITAIDLGTRVAPVVVDGITGISDVAQQAAGFIDGLPGPVKDLGTQLGAVALIAGPAALGIGKLATASGSLLTALSGGGLKALLGIGPAGIAASIGVAALAKAWYDNAQEERDAAERAEVYSGAIAEATGINSSFAEEIARATAGLDEQRDALTEAGAAARGATPDGQAFAAIIEQMGGNESVDAMNRMGVSMADLAAIVTGSRTPEQLARYSAAVSVLSANSDELGFSMGDLGYALNTTGVAMRQGVADDNARAESSLELLVALHRQTDGLRGLSAFEVELALAREKSTGATDYAVVAAEKLWRQYELLHPQITNADMAMSSAEAAFLGMGTAAGRATSPVGAMAKAVEDVTDELSPFDAALAGVNDELRAQYEAATDAGEAVDIYRRIVDDTYGPQQRLDDKIDDTARALARMNDEQDIPAMRDYASAVRDQAFAMAENGASTDEVNRFLAVNEEQLQRVLTQAGLTQGEIELLLDTYLRLPRDVVTNIAVKGESEARGAFLRLINEGPHSKPITAVAETGAARGALDSLAAQRTAWIDPRLTVSTLTLQLKADGLAGLVSGATTSGTGAASTSSQYANDAALQAKAAQTGQDYATVAKLYGVALHSGGVVGEDGDRLTGRSLAYDERPHVLQTGERVLSRADNVWFERQFLDPRPSQVTPAPAAHMSTPQVNIGPVVVNVSSPNVTPADVERAVGTALDRFATQINSTVGARR